MKKILVHVGHHDSRAAILEDDRLVEFYVEKPKEEIVGNVYLGKVVNVLPGMQAAFIDIGIGKNAFLHVNDAILPTEEKFEHNVSIKEVLKEGQNITVQVQKEPFGNKGARVTTHISLPGRYLVYMPYSNYVGVSRRIGTEDERIRLKNLGESLRMDQEGLIIRTVTLEANDVQIKKDLQFLRSQWNNALEDSKNNVSPSLVYKDLGLAPRLIRDLMDEDVKQFIIDNGSEYRKIKDMIEITAPDLSDRLYLYSNKEHLFERYNVQSELEKSVRRKIWLKSGGYIIIDKTEALTSIDVNTGKYIGQSNLEDTVLKTNIEAAVEIAKQLRLRDIGGIIIIDFIDMEKEEHGQKILDLLAKEMKKDKTKSNILGITQLGLVEMTRKKVRQSLDTILLRTCPVCDGTGRVISEEELTNKIEREITVYENHDTIKTLIIEVNPVIAQYILSSGNKLARFAEVSDKKIRIVSTENLQINHYTIQFEYEK